MPRCRLHKGLHFELCEREYVIEEGLRHNKLRVRNVATNETGTMDEIAIYDAWFEGNLKFLDEVRDTTLAERKENKSYYQDLSLLKDCDQKKRAIKKEFHRRFKYVTALRDARLGRRDKANVQTIIQAAHKTAGENGGLDPNPPSWKTLLYRWFHPFLSCGEDFRVLIPAYAARGNRKSKFTGVQKKKGQKFTPDEKRKAEEVAAVIIEVKDEKLAHKERITYVAIRDSVRARIKENNEFRDESDELPIPHDSSTYDFLNRNLNEYEKELLRHGEDYAQRKYKENKQGLILERPLQRVEIDHTTIDRFLIDPEVMLPIGRPTFTSAVDCFTKMDLGFYVSYNYPGYLATMQCLKHAILPKTYVKDRYPRVKHSWDCFGLPELIVVDNAVEFHSGSLQEACLQLGIQLQFRPKGMPWYGGSVERGLGTKNTGWVHRQPGTTFSNIFDKKDYDPEKDAICTIDEFMEEAHVFMIDVYPWETHRGIKPDKFLRHELLDFEAAPAKLWAKWIEKYPPALPPHRDELLVLLGQVFYRTISSSGIEFEGLFYNNPQLAQLRRKKSGGEKFLFKLDPSDLSTIYVEDLSGGYICVPALNQNYTEKLTLWQHSKIKGFARKKIREHEKLTMDHLIEAKQLMQEIVGSAWRQVKGSGARHTMARFRGVGQEDYSARQADEHAKNDDISVDLQPKSDVAALTPGAASLNGVSDLASAYVHSEALTDQATGAIIETAPSASATKPRSKKGPVKRSETDTSQSKTSQKTHDNNGQTPITADEEDDDLDMSGFSAGFDLPGSNRSKYVEKNS